MDTLSPEKRSWNMSRIRSKDTKPEVVVRSLLHGMGYRFRLHRRDLPGRPDIVLPKYRTAVFVNGCFWHRHEGCRYAFFPKTRVDFWMAKFQDTVERDHRQREELRNLDWRVVTIWECETRDRGHLQEQIVQRLGPRDE